MNRIDTSWMYGAINRYQNDAERLRNRTARLSADIDRLEAARDAVGAIYQDDKSFVSWVNSYDVGGSWQGSRREEFEEAKRCAKASGEEYCCGVAEIHQAICDKITQLENEREIRARGSLICLPVPQRRAEHADFGAVEHAEQRGGALCQEPYR